MTPYAASEPVERPRVDAWLSAAESALRTVGGAATATRPQPVPSAGSAGLSDGPSGASVLTEDERRLSGALMRVNHVGEVCAQALYQAQALTARTPALRQRMRHAAKEEIDHLAWTQARLDALGAHPSRLNPLWYAGSFAIGMAAGLLGDRVSLGFVVETEDQVERHLGEHLDRLPPRDVESRVIVEQMQADESKHAAAARDAGAVALPWPVKMAMKLAAKVMTSTAHRV